MSSHETTRRNTEERVMGMRMSSQKRAICGQVTDWRTEAKATLDTLLFAYQQRELAV